MGHPFRIPRDRPAGRPQPGYRRPQAHCALPRPLTSWPSNIQVVTRYNTPISASFER